MNCNSASLKFNVPYNTLKSRVNGTYELNVRKGPNSIFDENEEKELVQWIIQLSECGFPVTKEHLLDAVQNIVKKSNRDTPFTDGRPSRHWYKAFLSRNPELSEKMSQNLTKSRANISEKIMREWFLEVETYFKKKNLMEVGPESIFNMDESAFLMSPNNGKVLVKKGNKAVYNVCQSDKECYTVSIGGNAAGQLLPPMVVYNYERIPANVAKNFPDDFIIGKSDSGWMTSDTFYSYVVNHLYPWCVKKNIKFPVILYVDGHSSHLTKAPSDFCCDKNIELIGLVPNATHIHQPMDVGLLHSLKVAYKSKVREWRLQNNGASLTKIFFPKVLKNALTSLNLNKIFEKSFHACGLYPFNADSINYNKLIKFETKDNQKEQSESNTIETETTSNLSFFGQLQYKMDETVLAEFSSNNSNEWKGDLEYKQLYLFWQSCHNESKLLCNDDLQNDSDLNNFQNVTFELCNDQINSCKNTFDTNTNSEEKFIETDCNSSLPLYPKILEELYTDGLVTMCDTESSDSLVEIDVCGSELAENIQDTGEMCAKDFSPNSTIKTTQKNDLENQIEFKVKKSSFFLF